MEAIFPDSDGFAGLVLAGFRKDPAAPAVTQLVGTAVLKRSFAVDRTAARLQPLAEAVPVTVEDAPYNLVANSDLMAPEEPAFGTPPGWPEGWRFGAGVVRERRADPDADTGNGEVAWVLRVRGTADGRAELGIEGERPLAGTTFTLSFEARADLPAQVRDVALEADGGSGPIAICRVDLSPSTTFTAYAATGTWPGNVDATAFRLVLRTATGGARTVDYRRLQVEVRDHRTVYAPGTTVRYENDVASFKPLADVIVLGHADVPGACAVRIDGQTWLARVLASGAVPREKALFGWEPRTSDTRLAEAGDFPDQAEDVPGQWPPPFDRPQLDPLPDGSAGAMFHNRWFNGHDRASMSGAVPPGSFLPRAGHVQIVRGGGSDVYAFRLPDESVRATRFDFDGVGTDRDAEWSRHDVPMHPDTLVVEPERDRCYVVWRGVWPFHPDRHRRLVVEAVS